MGYQSFRELRVWQEAKKLAVEIYKLTAAQQCPVRFLHIGCLAFGLRTPKQWELFARNHEAHSGS